MEHDISNQANQILASKQSYQLHASPLLFFKIILAVLITAAPMIFVGFALKVNHLCERTILTVAASFFFATGQPVCDGDAEAK